MAKGKQAEYLPKGWEWRYEDEQTWTTSQGKLSTQKHFYNPLTNEYMSVRQGQKLQRIARESAGQPKPKSIPRTGKIRTIKGGHGPKRKIDKTARGGLSIYGPETHGRTESLDFYSLVSAQNYVFSNGLPSWAKYAIIQVRFTERLVATSKTGSDEVGEKNGYASLSKFVGIKDLEQFVTDSQPVVDEVVNPWVEAYSNITNYDMTGKNARVYILLQER